MLGGPVQARQSSPSVKIVPLSDVTEVYSDIGGQGNMEASKMAIEDFRGDRAGVAGSSS